MKAKEILNGIGTLVIVGAVSIVSAALWTNVLENKFQLAKVRRARTNSSKVIVVDFRKTRKDAGR